MLLKTLPDVHVAYMRHTGSFDGPGIPALWARLSEWLHRRGPDAPRRPMYGITVDDPMSTPEERWRYDACVEVAPGFAADDEVAVRELPGGLYGVEAFHGTANQIGAAWQRFWAHAMPASGLRPADGPILEYYDEDFEIDPATGAFHCLLCAPVHQP